MTGYDCECLGGSALVCDDGTAEQTEDDLLCKFNTAPRTCPNADLLSKIC